MTFVNFNDRASLTICSARTNARCRFESEGEARESEGGRVSAIIPRQLLHPASCTFVEALTLTV
jgi:hypothetical protein